MEHCKVKENDIFKAIDYDLRGGWGNVYIDITAKTFPLSYVIPSTEEEYNSFISSKKEN